jgi:Ca-activated chloride channel homolog
MAQTLLHVFVWTSRPDQIRVRPKRKGRINMQINAHMDFEVVALQQHDTITAMVELEAPTPTSEANEVAVHVERVAVVVVDRSGSMSGSRLLAAKKALLQLVDRMDDRDRLGVVVFDDEATVIAPAGPVGEQGKDVLRTSIAAMHTGGSTDLGSGYLRGLQEARRVVGDAGATVVLLSDGHANTGVVDPMTFRGIAAQAAADGITTSTIGIGVGYDDDILAEAAMGGGGNHSFAIDPDQAGAAIIGEFEGLLSKTVQNISVLVAPSSHVSEINILNDLAGYVVDSQIMTDIGDLYAGENRRLVVSFEVPGIAELGMVQIAQLTFSYTAMPSLEQHTVTVPVTVNVVPADVAAQRVPKPEVVREKLFLATQVDKREAEEALVRGDYDTTYQTLQRSRDRFDTLGAPMGAGFDEKMRAEAEWLEQSRDMVGSSSPDYLKRRLRADRTRKSRGHTREQGGERHDRGA